MTEMSLLGQESLRVVLLNTRNRVLGILEVYRGNVSSAQVRPAEVFRDAVRENCPSLIVVHNHPDNGPERRSARMAGRGRAARGGRTAGRGGAASGAITLCGRLNRGIAIRSSSGRKCCPLPRATPHRRHAEDAGFDPEANPSAPGRHAFRARSSAF